MWDAHVFIGLIALELDPPPAFVLAGRACCLSVRPPMLVRLHMCARTGSSVAVRAALPFCAVFA